MPVSSATASRSRGDLRAEGECCSQSGKQNSFLSVSVSRSRLVIFRQADKQKICQSESPALWRISPGHMSSTHGPVRWRWRYWWCWCGLKICPWVSQCLCVSICKWENGMVRLRKAANMRRPPRGRVISQPGHTEARRRIKEWEMDFYSSKTTSLRMVKGACACVSRLFETKAWNKINVCMCLRLLVSICMCVDKEEHRGNGPPTPLGTWKVISCSGQWMQNRLSSFKAKTFKTHGQIKAKLKRCSYNLHKRSTATWVKVHFSADLYAEMLTGWDSMLSIYLPYAEKISVPPEITGAALIYARNDWCKRNRRICAKVMVSFAMLAFLIGFISGLKPHPQVFWFAQAETTLVFGTCQCFTHFERQ